MFRVRVRVRVVRACVRACVHAKLCAGPYLPNCALAPERCSAALFFVTLGVPSGVPIGVPDVFRLASRFVSRLLSRLLSRLVSRPASRLVSRFVSRLVSRLIPPTKGGRFGMQREREVCEWCVWCVYVLCDRRVFDTQGFACSARRPVPSFPHVAFQKPPQGSESNTDGAGEHRRLRNGGDALALRTSEPLAAMRCFQGRRRRRRVYLNDDRRGSEFGDHGCKV